MGDDFLANQRTSQPFDQIELRRNFIGAIDRDIDFRMILQSCERHSNFSSQDSRRLRCRYAEHTQPVLHALAQCTDEVGRRGSGTETDNHPVLYFIQRGQSSMPFEFIGRRLDHLFPRSERMRNRSSFTWTWMWNPQSRNCSRSCLESDTT